MAWPSNLRRFTEDEYLMLERASDSRSEFLDGQIFAMSGGSRAHRAQDRPRIDHDQRADEAWRIESVAGLEAQLALDALGLTLDLATVYERVAERW